MLYTSMAIAQNNASVHQARRQPCYSSLRHSPPMQEYHWARSRVISAENRPKYVRAALLLTLSLSLITMTITQGATNSVTMSGHDSLVTMSGANSFAYSWQWGAYGGPITPNGVTVDASGNVFIADAKNFGVYELAKDGSLLAAWGSQGTGPGHFNNPEGIARDPQGNVYVSDSVNNNIQKFTASGSFITSWGSTGTGNGQFKTPLGLSVNATGFLYVVDQGNQRVQIFRNNGTYVGSFGGLGSNLVGKFQSPFGVAVGPNYVYVSDSSHSFFQSGNVTEFTKTGGFVCVWGSTSLLQPAMVATDNASNVYVADNLENDVVKFTAC